LEDAVWRQVRTFIEALLEEELAAAFGRGRYERNDTYPMFFLASTSCMH
jgi:hypothetical protein